LSIRKHQGTDFRRFTSESSSGTRIDERFWRSKEKWKI